MAEAAPNPTRTAIMDAAERLMAEHGVNGISIRAILAEAGANTAALHYHFGSREQLIEAILARRGIPMDERRREMLLELESRESPPGVGDIVGALVDPFLEILRRDGDAGRRFICFLARLQLDRSNIHRDLEDRHFPDIRERITRMLLTACPHLAPAELERRVTMLLDTMFYSLGNANLPADEPDEGDAGDALADYADTLKSFLAGGLEAKAGSRPGKPRTKPSKKGPAS